jgi:LCP family protein required for cell wall assembly
MSTPRHLRADPDGAARPRRRRRRNWPQRLVLTAGCVVTVVCLAGASVAGYALVRWYGVDRVDVDVEEAAAGEPVNILLVGSDDRAGEGADQEAAVSGKRTDTIMVMRIDPQTEQVSVLSFPRDLWLPIADTDESARINSAYNAPGEQQVLIDTIGQNFGIEINHWIEVDFQGFRQLVDAIGGVTLYFDRGLRDRDAGLYIYDLGCVTLDGETALAYARSRKAEYDTEDGWVDDPQSDLSRIARQQNLMTEAVGTALSQASSNPLRLRELIDIGASNVSIDGELGLGDIRDLGEQFQDMGTDRFQTVALPVEARPGDEQATVVVDEAAAEPVLNVFRGLDPGEVSPGNVTVSVLNGTTADPAREREGLAGDVSAALETVGFEVGPPGDDNDDVHEHTTVRYAPGELTYGQRVARHITGGVVLEEDPSLDSGQVTVVAGADFTTVHEQPTPVELLPPALGAPATTAPPTTEGGDEQAPPSLPLSPTTTTPAQVGAVPPDAC